MTFDVKEIDKNCLNSRGHLSHKIAIFLIDLPIEAYFCQRSEFGVSPDSSKKSHEYVLT